MMLVSESGEHPGRIPFWQLLAEGVLLVATVVLIGVTAARLAMADPTAGPASETAWSQIRVVQ